MKGIAALMSHIINFAEQKTLFEYYSSIPVKYIKSHEKIWGSLVPERQRYDINFDAKFDLAARHDSSTSYIATEVQAAVCEINYD